MGLWNAGGQASPDEVMVTTTGMRPGVPAPPPLAPTPDTSQGECPPKTEPVPSEDGNSSDPGGIESPSGDDEQPDEEKDSSEYSDSEPSSSEELMVGIKTSTAQSSSNITLAPA